MPDSFDPSSFQQFYRELLAGGRPKDTLTADFIRRMASLKIRRDWEQGRKIAATNVERFDLGCDNSGEPQYLIAMDVAGRREHHRTVKLPTSGDVQSMDPSDEQVEVATTEDSFLDRLSLATGTSQLAMICDAETMILDTTRRERLSQILWKFILASRDNPNSATLIAVGSAIRKYIAMLNVNRIGEIAELLETGHRAQLPLDLELEVTKMVYRKFEANPPAQPDPVPPLALRLWEIAQEYLRPRIMVRDKYATVASLSIEAIVALRSPFAQNAISAALTTRYSWFGEKVIDDLRNLAIRWRGKNRDAADWCTDITNRIIEVHSGNPDASKTPR